MESEQPEYHVVDSSILRTGWLVERPLFIHMVSSKKYILMVKALHPLEQAMIDKLKRTGNVYSTDPAIEKNFPKLVSSTHELRGILDDVSDAAFERHRKILDVTRWAIPHAWDVEIPADLMKVKSKPTIPVVLMHRAIGVPKAETLHYVSDLSVVMYERAITTATLAGLYAIWLGHSDLRLVSRFVEMTFCEELSIFAEGTGVEHSADASEFSELSSGELNVSMAMLENGKIPGIRGTILDKKIAVLFEDRTISKKTGEELLEIIDLARARALGENVRERCKTSRALKKLEAIVAKETKTLIEELEEEKKKEDTEKARARGLDAKAKEAA